MPAAEVNAAITGLRMLMQLGTAANELKTGAEIAAQVLDIQRKAQEAMLALTTSIAENHELQGRMHEAERKTRELEAELEKLKSKRAALDEFVLQELAGKGQFVMKRKGDVAGGVDLFYCISCHQKGMISLLQPVGDVPAMGGMMRIFQCTNKDCKAQVNQGPATRTGPHDASIDALNRLG